MPRVVTAWLEAGELAAALLAGDPAGALPKRKQAHLDAVLATSRADDAAVRAIVRDELGGIVELLRGAHKASAVDVGAALCHLPALAPLASSLDLGDVPVVVTQVRVALAESARVRGCAAAT